MASRAMIVVAGGSATRFGGEKLMTDVGGRPLIAHTVDAVAASADVTVVAARADLIGAIEALQLDVVVTMGGASRTGSELSGLTALGREYDLIGIHDAARPLVKPEMIEALYVAAEEIGGAVPTLEPAQPLVRKLYLTPIVDAVTVQTPQVFRGPELLAAYVHAAQTGFDGHDTVDVIQRFGDVEIASIGGDPENIKVTFPEDLEVVRSILEGPSRSEPR